MQGKSTSLENTTEMHLNLCPSVLFNSAQKLALKNTSDIYFWQQLAILVCVSNASPRTFWIVKRCVKVVKLRSFAKDDTTSLNLLALHSHEFFTVTIQRNICLSLSKPVGSCDREEVTRQNSRRNVESPKRPSQNLCHCRVISRQALPVIDSSSNIWVGTQYQWVSIFKLQLRKQEKKIVSLFGKARSIIMCPSFSAKQPPPRSLPKACLIFLNCRFINQEGCCFFLLRILHPACTCAQPVTGTQSETGLRSSGLEREHSPGWGCRRISS